MRATLRRSCNACARAKHRCDLRSPQCSRCVKRKSGCVYANEPLTSQDAYDRAPPDVPGNSKAATKNDGNVSPPGTVGDTEAIFTPASISCQESSVTLMNPANTSFDPFDSYPPTRLPRVQVQLLIRHFLSNIAFQYYPLDLNMESNPFVVSWWPLALNDSALFHVSLQTASLDVELRAQRGFPMSELLMVDSVSLVRRKVEDPSVAFQDETLNSVVTLAAIEHGKGNIEGSRMHIDGIRRIVGVRGGIDEVKRTSPLSARMVSWVSMLVTGAPQFPTQDDFGVGGGIGPILQWQLAVTSLDASQCILDGADLDPAISSILARLRHILHPPRLSGLTNTELHDLTCFVTHRLLLLPLLAPADPKRSAVSECLRYALALYMLIIHGTTYYSHVDLANALVLQLRAHLTALGRTNSAYGSLEVWVLSIGMVAAGTEDPWFTSQACTAAVALGLRTWDDVLARLEGILWMTTQQGETLFREKWDKILPP